MPVTLKVKKSSAPKGIYWPAVKEKFFAENMLPSRKEPYTLRDVSIDYGVAYAVAKERSAMKNEHGETWVQELARLKKAAAVATVEEVRRIANFDEAEIRIRHQQISKVMLAKAIAALQRTELSKPSDIFLFLKLGLEQEREAAGLPRLFTEVPIEAAMTGKYESPMDKLARHRRFQALAEELRRKIDGVPVKAVESTGNE